MLMRTSWGVYIPNSFPIGILKKTVIGNQSQVLLIKSTFITITIRKKNGNHGHQNGGSNYDNATFSKIRIHKPGFS